MLYPIGVRRERAVTFLATGVDRVIFRSKLWRADASQYRGMAQDQEDCRGDEANRQTASTCARLTAP